MKWATRAGIHIDRAACAWLIRRTIDGCTIRTLARSAGRQPRPRFVPMWTVLAVSSARSR
jgi:hypothetical protein